MINLNDPQLTAYALGELDGQEAEHMKQLIEKDPAAKKYVEDIQATARELESEFSAEPTPRLSVAEREHVLAVSAKRPWWRSGLGVRAGGFAAAGLALVAVLLIQTRNSSTEFSDPVEAELQAQATSTGREGSQPRDHVDTAKAVGVVGASSPTKGRAGAPSAKVSSPTAVAKNEVVVEADEMRPYRFGGGGEAKSPIAAGDASAPSASAVVAMSGKADGAAMADVEAESFAPAPSAPRFQVSARKKLADKLIPGGGFAAQEIAPAPETEAYKYFDDSAFKAVKDDARSTFSIDVDTASYANMRRFLVAGQLPPKDAVRTEELINYFRYEYAAPTGNRPFSVSTEVTKAPWNSKHHLVRIGLKGKTLSAAKRPPSNLVFLLDVSGSMNDANKLPLVQKSMKLLVENLTARDRISIVVYAGATGIVLPSTAASEKSRIMSAIDELQAGGGTDGASGIELAYREAQKNFLKEGINRVILATDGDFNIGRTSEGELTRLIQDKAKSGVFLSVLGFGMGNYKDSTMQALANKGNGNHAYIDSLREARKVLVEEAGGTLNTIAKDVKIQVEFNPRYVAEYRLIGYEKRMLNHEDFNDDQKDAGEIGEGHTVTAIYEVIPAGEAKAGSAGRVDPLKYQKSAETPQVADASGAGLNEMMNVKLRYKKPDGDRSELIEQAVSPVASDFGAASADMKFAAAVAGFAMILRDSPYKSDLTLAKVEELAAKNAAGDDYRSEFVELIKKARSLAPQK